MVRVDRYSSTSVNNVLDCLDPPISLPLILNPTSRNVLRDLNNHVHAFALFLSKRDLPIPCHRSASSAGHMDASALQTTQLEIRGVLDMAGLNISSLMSMYDNIEKISQSENDGRCYCIAMVQALTDSRLNMLPPDITKSEWAEDLFVHHTSSRLSNTTETKIVQHLSNDTQLLRSQAGLFTQNHTSASIENNTIDIITKETLPTSRESAGQQRRELRRCTICGARAAIWLPPPQPVTAIAGVIPPFTEMDGFESRWLEKWQDKCICGGSWQQVS